MVLVVGWTCETSARRIQRFRDKIRLTLYTVKFLFWQFGSYALAAFALGFLAAWSWFRERLQALQRNHDRAKVKSEEVREAKRNMLDARTAESDSMQALLLLRTRLDEAESLRVSAEMESHSLRTSRLKLLAELSELRSVLSVTSVSNARLSSSEREASRLRDLLERADEQLRYERAAREQTLAALQRRLSVAEEIALSTTRRVANEIAPSPISQHDGQSSRTTGLEDAKNDSSTPGVIDLREIDLREIDLREASVGEGIAVSAQVNAQVT